MDCENNRTIDSHREQELKQPRVGSVEERVTLDPIGCLLDEGDDCLGKIPVRVGRRVEGSESSLSFLSIRSAIRDCPDPGESGEASDVEAFR